MAVRRERIVARIVSFRRTDCDYTMESGNRFPLELDIGAGQDIKARTRIDMGRHPDFIKERLKESKFTSDFDSLAMALVTAGGKKRKRAQKSKDTMVLRSE